MAEKLTISERLLKLRTLLGLSQQKLAEQLGVTRNWVNMLEGDPDRVVSRAFLVRLQDLEEQANRAEVLGSDPRKVMKLAREKKGLTIRELARETGYSVGVLQALEEGHGRGSERQIEKIADVLGIPVSALMQGAEPKIISETGLTGTMGARPNLVAGPGVKDIRYVPHISFAQAGAMKSWEDAGYAYEGHVAFDSKDPKAFAVTVRGDSMLPIISEGDVIIAYPSRQARNGDVVLAKLTDDAGGDVMVKVYSARDAGKRVVLTSYNHTVHPPLDYDREEFQFVYPIASVTKNFLSK